MSMTAPHRVLSDACRAYRMEVRKLLDEAMEKRPRRAVKDRHLRADYRAGYFDAMLHVWCLLALVEYPEVPGNAARIAEILGRKTKN